MSATRGHWRSSRAGRVGQPSACCTAILSGIRGFHDGASAVDLRQFVFPIMVLFGNSSDAVSYYPCEL